MANVKNFAVLGSGNGGRAFCGQIAARGYPVIMYEPLEETDDYRKLRVEKKMFLEGDIAVGGDLRGVSTDIQQVLQDADIVLIVVPSFAHRPIFQRMIPHLRDGQHVIIVPGNYGGLLLKKMMADLGVSVGVFISETASLPYACRISQYNTVMIHKKKFRMKLATSPAEGNFDALAVINDIFDGWVQFFGGNNLLEMGLDNINQILHPFPVLLNYGAIERHPDSFRHYMDGVTPLISETMIRMDHERLAVGRALALDLMPTLDQLKMYYGENDAQSYYEYVNSAQSPYKDIVGHSVRSRYITEDVPGLLAPALELARLVDVPVAVTELCVRLASVLHEVDYAADGTSLEKLGLAGKSAGQILELAS